VTRGAGGGRPSKDQARRDRPAMESLRLPADRTIPEPIRTLTADQAALWSQLWASPAAAAWCVSDAAPLTRLVVLETADDPDVKVLAELRQLEDRFLLSPWARRVAKVELDTPNASQTRVNPSKNRTGALKVINGSA
jgi:hypothetical protein